MPPCVGLLRAAVHRVLADEQSCWLQVAVQHAVAQSLVDFKRACDLVVARNVVAALKLERQHAAEAAAAADRFAAGRLLSAVLQQ